MVVKKAFKILFLAIGVLVLIFLSLGIFKPDVSYQNSITVNATPEEAFKIFTDTTIMKQWISGLTHIEYVEGEMNSAGSKWKLFIKQKDEHYQLLETMTAFEINRRFAFVLDHEMFQTAVDILFTPSPQGTIITVQNTIKGNSMLSRSLFVLTGFYFNTESQKMYDTLKQLIDKSAIQV